MASYNEHPALSGCWRSIGWHNLVISCPQSWTWDNFFFKTNQFYYKQRSSIWYILCSLALLIAPVLAMHVLLWPTCLLLIALPYLHCRFSSHAVLVCGAKEDPSVCTAFPVCSALWKNCLPCVEERQCLNQIENVDVAAVCCNCTYNHTVIILQRCCAEEWCITRAGTLVAHNSNRTSLTSEPNGTDCEQFSILCAFFRGERLWACC